MAVNNNMQSMIERYKRELVEFNKKNSGSKVVNSPAAQTKMEIAQAVSGTVADPAPSVPVPTPVTQAPVPQEEIVAPFVGNAAQPPSEQSGAAQGATPGTAERIYPQSGLTRLNPQAIGEEELSPEQLELKAIDDERISEESQSDFSTRAQQYPPYNIKGQQDYDGIDSFLEYNRKTGFLRVQVYASQQTFPVSNAKVIVSKPFGGVVNVFYTELTDVSGVVFGLTLPAPDKNLSAYPTSLLPYSTYTVTVEHASYGTATFNNCAIFDGIETVQLCELVPLSQGAPQSVVYEEEPESR